MMNNGWFAPTVNLENIDPRCGKVDYIQTGGREIQTDYVVSNNFAFWRRQYFAGVQTLARIIIA